MNLWGLQGMAYALSLDNTVARAIDADERVRQAKARHGGRFC